MMSGSGPTVFAIVESQAQAQQVKDRVNRKMNNPDLDFWITKFNPSGIRIAAPETSEN
jgi:4-diphosphocytidyl-2-C-methyl-D-erythritol kinase